MSVYWLEDKILVNVMEGVFIIGNELVMRLVSLYFKMISKIASFGFSITHDATSVPQSKDWNASMCLSGQRIKVTHSWLTMTAKLRVTTLVNSQWTCTWRSGRETQKAVSWAWRLERTGSIVEKIVPQSPPEMRRSVIDAMMQTFDSGLTPCRTCSKGTPPTWSMIWAFFMLEREAMFKAVMFRRTFASPTMVKIRLTDIVKAD